MTKGQSLSSPPRSRILTPTPCDLPGSQQRAEPTSPIKVTAMRLGAPPPKALVPDSDADWDKGTLVYCWPGPNRPSSPNSNAPSPLRPGGARSLATSRAYARKNLGSARRADVRRVRRTERVCTRCGCTGRVGRPRALTAHPGGYAS